jgi:hypothetical protein
MDGSILVVEDQAPVRQQLTANLQNKVLCQRRSRS